MYPFLTVFCSYGPVYGPNQVRGPFDFIGNWIHNWIQSSDWFPIEINVPDTFSNVGAGFQSFTQNVGNGFQTFQQNVGNGFQQFQQNVGNGWQQLQQNVGNGVNGLTQSFGNGVRNFTQTIPIFNTHPSHHGQSVRYFLLVPVRNVEKVQNNIKNEKNPMDSDDLLEFP